ncbi:MAG TPA: hypothetical protein VN207_02290, partial [Ktedonobacteraceae bacterium]|nr:hypothetical protein [Ktedonobacteraceae bacterium]
DHELVLRFLIFRNLDAAALQDIGDSDNFLMKKMRELATSKDFDKEKEEKYFKETFELLASTTKENSFRKYNFVRGKFVGGFLISAYETIALGIGYHIDHLNGLEMNIEEKVKQLWRMQEFIENADSSRAASSRIPRVIPLGRRLFI